MYNLAAVFDLRVKLSSVLILLGAYCENMNQEFASTKAKVNQLLHDIYILYDEKIRGSSASHLQIYASSSSISHSLSIFSFISH